ncbi:hypothetical protein [Flavobacterium sp. '19STA2R22 D10 B1']|uniref:hypothetical protein n=1 Tax=Flavobacterium aerium TaxID=3037261 RepID=UPI00278C5055|nr:hypothetical protein [Flavobacterium sp. '19STA2R22 D10 B1']
MIYQNLRVQAGLSGKSDEAAKIGLNNTVHFVGIKDDANEYIGMGKSLEKEGIFVK